MLPSAADYPVLNAIRVALPYLLGNACRDPFDIIRMNETFKCRASKLSELLGAAASEKFDKAAAYEIEFMLRIVLVSEKTTRKTIKKCKYIVRRYRPGRCSPSRNDGTPLLFSSLRRISLHDPIKKFIERETKSQNTASTIT